MIYGRGPGSLSLAFAKQYAATLKALLNTPAVPWFSFSWPMTEDRYFAQVERELAELFNEAEAWAYIERSMRHYASRA